MMAAALALLLCTQDPVQVTVQTRNGRTYSGTTDLASFPFESSLGKSTIQLKDMAVLSFDGAGATVQMTDGTSVKGKTTLESIAVKTKSGDVTIKAVDIVQIKVQSAKPADSGKPTDRGSGLLVATPVETLKLGAVITRGFPSPDGKRLFLLNASDSKLLVVNVETLELESEVALSGGETAMSLSPSGKVILAAGKKTVTSVSIADLKVAKTISIEMDVTDVCALDDGSGLVVGYSGIGLVVMSKQSIVQKLPNSGSRCYLVRGGTRLFCGNGSILLPDKSQGRNEMVFSMNRANWGSDYNISPDGRFGVTYDGTVVRFGKCFVAELVSIGKVDPNWSVAWSLPRKRLYGITGAAMVKEYDLDSWELQTSWRLGYRLSEAWIDATGTYLMGIGIPMQGDSGSRPPNQQPPLSDLYKFEIPK